IHSHLFESEIISREKIFDSKYFSHCHDNMSPFKNFSFKIIFEKRRLTDFYEKQYLLKKYLKCKNKFIAISEDTKQYFEKTLPQQLNNNILLLNNAIDFSRFNSANCRRRFDKIRIVNVG